MTRGERGYAKAKRASLDANVIRRELAERDRLKREAEERNNGPRRERLLAKALRDTKGLTGEYKERKQVKRKWLHGKRP